MRHFLKEDWLLFSQHLLDGQREIEMEKHLENCNDCLEIYIQTIEEMPAYEYSQNLTQVIMQQIPKKKNYNKNKMLFEYFVAASITLFLMTSGVFQFISNAIPSTTTKFLRAEDNVKNMEFIRRPDHLTQNAFSFLDAINNNLFKE
jgi:hypothetical protein